MQTPDMDYARLLRSAHPSRVGAAVLMDTAVTYATSPECRGTNGDGEDCVYLDETGTKRCALGRHLKDIHAVETGLLNSISAAEAIERCGLKHEWLEELSIKFWERLQNFHDTDLNFDFESKTLTPRGWAELALFLRDIKDTDTGGGVIAEVAEVDRQIRRRHRALAEHEVMHTALSHAQIKPSPEPGDFAAAAKQADAELDRMFNDMRNDMTRLTNSVDDDRRRATERLVGDLRTECRSGIESLDLRVRELEETVRAIKNAFG